MNGAGARTATAAGASRAAAETGAAGWSFAVVVLMVMLGVTRPARAVETRADLETDHIDAADEGGPRSFGVVLHPLALATGWLGAEVDVAAGEYTVVSLEGDGRWAWGLRGLRIEAGFALFPLRFAFHGLYVHPTVEWNRGPAGTVIGAGATVGYAWTWRCGATLRVGAGGGYATALAGDGSGAYVLTGLRPELDADVGWTF